MTAVASVPSLDYYVDSVASPSVARAYDEWMDRFFRAVRESSAEHLMLLEPEREVKRAHRAEARAIIGDVSEKHRSGHYIAAADSLLHCGVDFLAAEAFDTLNDVIALITDEIRTDSDLYSDEGLARVHSLLALTLRYDTVLSNRAALRSAYRARVGEREGVNAADRAVEYL
jgi:hypothetical protein